MITLLEFSIQSDDWGRINLARPHFDTISEDRWGSLAPLKDIPEWTNLIPVIPGEILSHALHGMATPLKRILGSPPEVNLKKVPEPFRRCRLSAECIGYRKEWCHPCLKAPECYEAPLETQEQIEAASAVTIAWRNGLYVIVVGEGEFVL